MNTEANAVPESAVVAPAVLSPARPFYWSVRREIWENRSLYIAPFAVAAFVLFASFINAFGLPRRVRTIQTLDPATRHAAVIRPFTLAPAPIMLAAFLVGFFYSLEALYGERRDRSILFWKSLPVSDRTTVLAKAAIPMMVLPLIAWVLGVIVFFILLFLSTAILLGNGMSPAILWREVEFVEEPLVMIYGLTAFTLWWAPIYSWLLLISAWARRAPFLWFVMPLLAVAAVERILFNTTHFMAMLHYRLGGAMKEAFVVTPAKGSHAALDQITRLDPGRFLMTPGLWVGLIFAAACLAAAVRLRRYREPI